ncbi:MAG: efflux RND transporter permease subunit [Acidobacteriota bacterium]
MSRSFKSDPFGGTSSFDADDASKADLERGVLAWFAANGVAANLLLLLIVFAGFITVGQVRQEVFPEITTDLITVTVSYLGAAPEEVEEGVCARIEERVQDLEVVDRVRSTAREGVGVVTIELVDDVDVRAALDDVKSRVDAIDTFPEETEQPIIQEVVVRQQAISIAITGSDDERVLKRLAEQVRDDLVALDSITQAELAATRPYEIAIEVSEDALRRYQLSFDAVANAVRGASLDLPGGSVRTADGEILLRTEGQVYRGLDFASLPLRTLPDGTRLSVGDVATVVDGFAETDEAARFDGRSTALVQVFRVGEQNVLDIVGAVKAYVAQAQPRMPAGVTLTLWQDDTVALSDRLDTLFRNGRAGLALVFVVLALLLRLKLAMWTAVGILASFFGALWLMPSFDLAINVISLFGFIVVLGIVVDDAIVVGENIYRHYEMGKEGLHAAVDGVREVAVPVLFAVLTSIAAFMPLATADGSIGQIVRVISLIVILTLVFSLIESLLILPTHLSHLKHDKQEPRGIRRAWRRFQDWLSAGFDRIVQRFYRPLLERAIQARYVSLAIALATLLITLGWIGGGRTKFTFFPPIEGDIVIASLTMPQGTSVDATGAALLQLERGAEAVRRAIEGEAATGNVFRHVLTSIGSQPCGGRQAGPDQVQSSVSASHLGEVCIELPSAEVRSVSAAEIGERWREAAGPVADAVELTFASSLFRTGEAINVQLAGPNLDHLSAAADRLKTKLQDYPGVFDIADSFRAGKRELSIQTTREGEAMGFALRDLARQVRQGFYGEEAQRIQRGRDDVRVMVRYPSDARASLESLEGMRVRAPDGTEVPFSVVGTVDAGRGFASIARTDRNRTVNVTADVDLDAATPNEIIADLTDNVLPTLLADYPGMRFSLEGEQQEQRESIASLQRGFALALVIIYALLAIPFRSYLQPFIVMSAIPFGIIGAVWGHVLMGLNLTVLSMFGVVALTGIVVNDSLMLVDFINRARRSGMETKKAIREAGVTRFRPIVLTSLTTFFGLLPLLLEKSLQAQFLIPMATSLAFGVLFATVIILLIVPVLYKVLEDLRALWHWYWDGERRSAPLPAADPTPG